VVAIVSPDVALAAGLTMGLSQVFGCTLVGPPGWGQALLATGVAAVVSAAAPALLSRASTAVRSSITTAGDDAGSLLDDEDAGTHQQRVDLPQRRREQVHTGHDERVAAGARSEFRHAARQTDGGDQSGSPE